VIRDDRGEFTLVGLLVTMMVLGFVLMATYGAFDVFGRNVSENQTRLESTDRARNTSDTLARELRNLATPTALQPNAIVRSTGYDIVFETVAPTGTAPPANPQNIQFVRYCLDDAARTLWSMALPPTSVTGSTVPPTTTACPGAGWSNTHVVATDVVNTYNNASRPVFAFDTATRNLIRRVTINLFVDTTPGTSSAEQQISTGVNLRNQDAAPTAAMTATPGGTGMLVLDGTGSTDPDNDPLGYCWYDSAATSTSGRCGPHSVGDTATLRYSYGTATGIQHTITLKVTDPSGLASTSDEYAFTS
jgi:hypothetical protein